MTAFILTTAGIITAAVGVAILCLWPERIMLAFIAWLWREEIAALNEAASEGWEGGRYGLNQPHRNGSDTSSGAVVNHEAGK